VTVAGQGVVTGANGDQANYTMLGTSDFSNNPCVANLTITADGGTGGFADVSGTIEAVVLTPWSGGIPCTGEQSITLNGTIAY
jgi:hypothetical protein